MMQGRLILVVGPSGAGKDTLLNFARAELAQHADIVFARRVITRPADVTEDHEPVSEAEFATQDFALSWQAHGLSYGIRKDIEADLAAGRQVVANVSRGIIPQARETYRCLVVEITASPEILAVRLAQRGRETAEDIAARLRRTVAQTQADAVILNDTTPREAGLRLISLLNTIHAD
jgi:phosphonate metabolism protein PhnN/1,5-bisphosphokinase (PRPP-forming)